MIKKERCLEIADSVMNSEDTVFSKGELEEIARLAAAYIESIDSLQKHVLSYACISSTMN